MGGVERGDARGAEAIDRSRPPYRDDPVIAALTDAQVHALVGVLARLARAAAAAEVRRRAGSEHPADWEKLSS